MVGRKGGALKNQHSGKSWRITTRKEVCNNIVRDKGPELGSSRQSGVTVKDLEEGG